MSVMSRENLGKEINMSLRQRFERDFESLYKELWKAKEISPQEFRILLEKEMPTEILARFSRNNDEGDSAYLFMEVGAKIARTHDYYPSTDMTGLISKSQENFSIALRDMPYRHVRKEGSIFSWFLRETNS